MKRLVLILFLISMAGSAFAQSAKCTKAAGQIAVTNPFPNWRYDSSSMKPEGNSCTLEKKDSAENPVYVNTQVQVMFNDRHYVSVSIEDWFKDKLSRAQSEEGVSEVQASDTTLAGKKAKKLTYTKLWKSSDDPSKSVKVFHEDYFVVEPGYALDVSTYVPEPDAARAKPEIGKILQTIELK